MAKYVIIGGVAGGATAAARLRRLAEEADIIVFEKGEHISYANCGLPYYLGGIIPDRERLFVQTPASFGGRFRIDVRVKNEVMRIDPAKQVVHVHDVLNQRNYTEAYDKLILSPGAEPIRPGLPGIGDLSIYTLRNVSDIDRIHDHIQLKQPHHAVVVGAGFIGLEMAENLTQRGITVTIVEMADQVMTPLDYEMAAEVHQHLKTKQVEFYLKDGVSSFDRQGKRLNLHLQSGRMISTDMVILSIGIRPENRLAKEAGIELGPKGGIKVNAYLQTSDPHIYAVGDAIEFPDPLTGESSLTYLAGPANKQGRIAADNIVFGNTREYKGSIHTAIAKVFDLTVASCGLSEKNLKKTTMPYLASIIHASSHAGYYPNATPLSLKILFAPQTGRLLGAQLIGYEGIDKRIDVLSTVIRHQGTIYDLIELEHAYAPPYSSAKDPVQMAGYVAENILQNKVKIIHWHQISGLNREETILLDVRTVEEFKIGTIEGAINIPLDELRARLTELSQNRTIIVFCGVGLRGYLACRILSQLGFSSTANLSGGYKTYQYATQKQSNEDIFSGDFIDKDDHIYQSSLNRPQPLNIPMVQDIDACGLQCPGPILRLKTAMDQIQPGNQIRMTATDAGFYTDVEAWCQITGHRLLERKQEKGKIISLIEKQVQMSASSAPSRGNHKTIIVFSDNLDRALASFVIANGAASTGQPVTLFFTFWGLNVIKRHSPIPTRKDMMGRMFGWMMPNSAAGLRLSKLNMLGLGSLMMKWRMRAKQVDSLETMIRNARDTGVHMIACQMSMDIMGISQGELLEGVSIGGVATYLAEAEQSNLNLVF